MEHSINQVIIPQIEIEAKKEGISSDGIIALQTAFSPHFQSFADYAILAKDVREDEPKKARDLRLKIKGVRLASESTRREMKADSLRRGRAIDGVNNILLLALVPIEEGLEKIEKAEELRETARKDALALVRETELGKYVDHPEFMGLRDMPEAQYADLLAGMIAGKKAKEEKAEADRLAKIEADRVAKAESERIMAERAAERARLVAENARLEKIAEDERAARHAAEIQVARERAEAARLAKIETDKRVEAERIQRMNAHKEREEAEAKAKADLAKERAERERLQAEIQAKEKVEADRIALEIAAAKKAAAAPDAEKIHAFADRFSMLSAPELSDKAIQEKIQTQIMAMHRWLVTLSIKIGE